MKSKKYQELLHWWFSSFDSVPTPVLAEGQTDMFVVTPSSPPPSPVCLHSFRGWNHLLKERLPVGWVTEKIINNKKKNREKWKLNNNTSTRSHLHADNHSSLHLGWQTQSPCHIQTWTPAIGRQLTRRPLDAVCAWHYFQLRNHF